MTGNVLIHGTAGPTWAGPTPVSSSAPVVPVVPRARARWLPPGWPLMAMLVGYPIWWVLGIAEIVPLLAACVMAAELLHLRALHVRRGFSIWLLFLAWVLIGALLLQVDAPGAIPGGSSTRYITFAFRVAWYLAATITLLYVYNLRERVPTMRIVRWFAWMFVTVAIGGIIGTIAPALDFRSAIEYLLPEGLSRVQFVHDLVHPVVAQRYTVEGMQNPRVSAPFAYTNDWGLNFACLLPFFVVGWLGRGAGWRRPAGAVILVAAAVPVVLSQNRGLWLALVLSAVLISVRSVLLARFKLFAGMLGLGVAISAVLLTTPIGTNLQHRLDNGYSNSGRTSLGTHTVQSVVSKSPVVGLGTTRNIEGSFYSIAGGNTATCSLCTPPALGTQGHFWLIIFSTGIGGTLLYFGFVLLQFFRHASIGSPVVTLGLSVLASHLITSAVYDTIGIALVTIFAAIGLMWREARDRDEVVSDEYPRKDPTVGGYLRLARRNFGVFAVCCLVGMAGAGALRFAQGTQVEAITTVFVSTGGNFVTSSRAETLDTIAQFIDAPPVLSAASRAAGRPISSTDSHLYVTAVPNSRVLEIHFTGPDAARAVRAADMAASAVIADRTKLFRAEQSGTVAALSAQQRLILDSTDVLNREIAAHHTPTGRLRAERAVLLKRAASLRGDISRAQSATPNSGVIVGHARAREVTDVWAVALSSGLMIGLLLAYLISLGRNFVGARVRHRLREKRATGLPILGWLSSATEAPDGDDLSSRVDRPLTELGGRGSATFCSADPKTHGAAGVLDRAVRSQVPSRELVATGRQRVVVVAAPSTRTRQVELLRSDLERRGATISGLVLVGKPPVRASRRARSTYLRLQTDRTV